MGVATWGCSTASFSSMSPPHCPLRGCYRAAGPKTGILRVHRGIVEQPHGAFSTVASTPGRLTGTARRRPADASEQGGLGMKAEVKGSTLPVLEMILEPGEAVVSTHGDLAWMTANMQLSQTTSGGGGGGLMAGLKRVAGGGGIFLTRYEPT